MIANALVALSGSIVCQEQRAFSSTMGTGQVVFGLATVIVGTTLFRKMSFVKGTTVLFLVVLVVGNRQKGGAEHA